MPPPSPYKIRPSPARTKRSVSDDGKEGTVVAIRMRPLNNNEGGKKRVWQVMPKHNAVNQTSRDGKLLDRIAGRTYFNYDKTFGEETNTVEVYNDIAKPIVTSVVNGLNGTIFAYGQTSSGKTYTMQGSGSIEDGSHSGGGIVHMAVRDIFSHIESQKDRMFLVRASFLEIYNEDVRDLLSDSTASLPIREDPRHGVFVQSVEETVTDFESLLEILFHGEKSRQVASTGMNERSSRSHTIFRITIESRENVEGSDDSQKENDSSQNDGAVLVSTLNLVDLAGSESVRHTGASGDRQKEGGMINQSLLTLSRVIQALGTNQGHVNFRDSKLTRLLQSSLSGNAKMAVICCATPSELYLEETRSTLQFASRASLVKTNAQVNEVLDDRSMIKRLQRELAEAKKNISAPGPAEIQAMEDKAAMETRARIARLTSCLLNGGHLFASIENSMVLSPAAVGMKQRKRRQSEGNFFTNIKSPLKLSQQINIAPSTEPKRKKTRQVQQQSSPKSQLNIVREALSSRSNFARSLQDTVSNMKFVIQNAESRFKEEKESNDSKMVEFQERYEALQQDHDKSLVEKAAARDENARLMDESAKVHDDYEAMKKQNADLQEQLGQLLSDFNIQRQQNEAKINELETLRFEIAEVERLLREEEEKAHEKDEQLSKFEVEQESMKEQLGRQKAEFTAWSEAQTVKTQSLQEEISNLQQDGEIKIDRLNKELTELNLTVEQQNAEIENLRAQKAEVEAKLETTETSLEDVEEELEISRADMSSRIESLEEKLQASESENTQVKKHLEETITAKDMVEQKVAEVETNIEEDRAQIQKLIEEKTDLEAKLETAETSLEDTEEELEIVRSDMSGRIESLEEKLQAAEAETARVTKEYDETNTKKDELEGKLQSCRAELESLVANKTALESALADTSDEKTELDIKQQQLEDKLADLGATCEEKQDQIEKLQAENSDIETKLETTKASLEDSEARLELVRADLNGKMESLEEQLQASKSETAKAKEEMEEALSKHETTRKELEKTIELMFTEKEEIETKLADAGSQKAELQSQHQVLEEKIVELTFSVEQHQTEIEKLHSEKKNLESILDEAEKSLEDSEEQLEKTKEDMDERLKALEEKLKATETEATDFKKALEDSTKEKDVKCKELEEKLRSISTEKQELDEELHSLRNEIVALRGELQTGEEWKQFAVSEQEKYLETIKDLKSVLDEKKNGAVSLSKEHDEVCQMLEKAKDDIRALEGENLELWSNVTDLGEKLLSLGTMFVEKEEEAEATRNHWYGALHECSDAKIKIGVLEEESRSGQRSLMDARNKLDTAYAKIQAMEVSEEKSILEKEEQILQLIDTKNELDGAYAKIQSMESSQEEDILEKEEQILQLQQAMDTANSKSMAIAAELNAVVQNLNQQKALNQNLENTRKELESKVVSISIELDQLTTEKKNMQADTSDAEGTIVELKGKLAQAESTILQIRTSNQEIIAEQEEAYRELESRLKELFRGLESLKDEKGDLEDQIVQLENEKRELQASCESLSEEKKETNKLLEQTTQDLSANEETILKANETINDLQDRLKISEEQLKEIAMDHESKMSSLQERLTSSLKEIDILKSKKFGLETRIEELESGLDCQLQALQEELLQAQSANEKLTTQAESIDVTTAENRSEVMEIKTMTTAILAEKDAVEALLSESQLQVHQLEEQLDNARTEHEQALTNTALQLDEQQKKLETIMQAKNEAESNLNKRLRDRELERDEATAELQKLYTKNKELSQSIATCVTKERELELTSQISDLKQETIELKQLLISANDSEARSRKEAEKFEVESESKSRELEDAFYRLSQMEDELRMAYDSHEKEIERSQDGLLGEIQQQKAELEKILDQERMDRQKDKEALKRRMGEEQRLLIHEAEEKFNELRNTASELEARLEQSESEGYQARQEAEELRDQNKEIEDKCIALENAVSDLKSFVSDQEDKMSALQSDLQKAKAESYALKETVIEMKERARKASRESEKALRESQISSDEVLGLQRKISSLEQDAIRQQEEYEQLQTELLTARTEAADADEMRQKAIKSKDEHIERVEARLIQLEGDSKRLAVELRMARVQSATHHAAAEDSELQQKIEQLTAQMKKKDSRIKKLEQVRLTKDQVESIKKMKTDSVRLEEECKRLNRKNSELLEQLESSGSQPSSVEVDELRSDKKTLEKKLMKYVSHCQSLMDDQASMVDALRSCNIHIENDSDPNDAVIALCDKYREAKRAQSTSNENAIAQQLEKKNKALVAQIKELKDTEREFSARSTQFQKEIEGLKSSLSNAKDDFEETKSTLKREISTLKEEALQAIHEKKAAKKKLQRVQSELEMMRMNASMDNPTVDFTVSDLHLVGNSNDSPLKHTGKERASIRAASPLIPSIPKEKSRPPLGDATNATLTQSGATKSNTTNKNLSQQINKPVLNSASKPAPGLGEAAAMYDDENTQECKQS